MAKSDKAEIDRRILRRQTVVVGENIHTSFDSVRRNGGLVSGWLRNIWLVLER